MCFWLAKIGYNEKSLISFQHLKYGIVTPPLTREWITPLHLSFRSILEKYCRIFLSSRNERFSSILKRVSVNYRHFKFKEKYHRGRRLVPARYRLKAKLLAQAIC